MYHFHRFFSLPQLCNSKPQVVRCAHIRSLCISPHLSRSLWSGYPSMLEFEFDFSRSLTAFTIKNELKKYRGNFLPRSPFH